MVPVFYVNNDNKRYNMKNIEKIYRVVLDNIEMGIIIFAGADGKIIYANDSACKILGFSKSELKKRNVTDLILWEKRGKVTFNELAESFSEVRKAKNFHIQGRCGKPVSISLRGNQIIIDSSVYYQIDFSNPHLPKDDEKKYSLMEDKYIKLLDLIPYGIVRIDHKGDIIYVNRTFNEMYCSGSDEIAGNSFFDFLYNEDDKSLLKEYCNFLGSDIGEKKSKVFETVKKDGSILQVNIYWASLRDLRGRGKEFLGIITEITDDMRAGMALKDLIREFDKSKKDLEQFTIAVSHDLQEPLNTVHSFLELLKNESDLFVTGKGGEYFGRIEESIKRMQSMIGELLILSKIPWDSKSLIKIDLKKILKDVISDLGSLISETSAKVEISDLPHISGIPTHIHRLFMNIISNSIKFRSDDRYPVIRIYGSKHDDGTVKIFVEDNGIGFESYQSDRIFDLFKRLNPKSKYKGSGIGLAICRKIMELHSGRIEARKNSKEGSTFILTF